MAADGEVVAVVAVVFRVVVAAAAAAAREVAGEPHASPDFFQTVAP